MSGQIKKKVSISQLFKEQVAINFVVVAILIVLAALLVFKVDGENYTQYTVFGLIAAIYFSFVAFLPAGTLFASGRSSPRVAWRSRRVKKPAPWSRLPIPGSARSHWASYWPPSRRPSSGR